MNIIQLTRAGPVFGLRMNPHCISRQLTRLVHKGKFFTHRTIPIWNSLPLYVIAGRSVNVIKNRIDNHMNTQRSTVKGVFRLGSYVIRHAFTNQIDKIL